MQTENAPVLFAGTSHPKLAKQVADCLGLELGKVLIETFPDGEIGVQILENVRGRDVFLLQTVARHPNLYLMELLILLDALKRASARSLVAVIPYYGYGRQDRKGRERVPITAKLVADLLEKAGVTRVLTMDLHSEQIQGFFNVPVDNLYARSALIEAVQDLRLDRCVVVTPDIGRIKMAREFAETLKVDFAIVDKRRTSANHVEPHALIGDVGNRDVLLIDDMCSTGKTLKAASCVCKKAGAKRIFAAVTHWLLVDVDEAFKESAIEKILVSDTICLPSDIHRNRLQVVSVASLFAKAIDSIVSAKSISSLFKHS